MSIQKRKKWTEEEIKFLKENYHEHGAKFIAGKLNRILASVKKKAKTLKLSVKKDKLFTKQFLEEKVKESYCLSDLCNKLEKTKTGATYRILKKYIKLYKIDTNHFNPYKMNRENVKNSIKKFPLDYWLQTGIKINSGNLKNRLYNEGIKKRECEKCGQGEIWNNERMSLILDHINGNPTDNRIENLRIVCPNCNATLPTHCRGHKKNI